MGYRTYVEDTQVFGNNEFYPEWIEFLKKQGVEVDEDCLYDGYITDVMGAIDVIETIIIRLETEAREKHEQLVNAGAYDKATDKKKREKVRELFWDTDSLFNFTSNYDQWQGLKKMSHNDRLMSSLTDEMIRVVNNGYVFISYMFVQAIKDKVELDNPFAVPGHLYCYKLKEGEKIHVHGG